MCTSLLLLDASANEEYQEEEFYQEAEAEEEGTDQYQNQGKLVLLAKLYHILSFIFLCFSKAFL